MVADHLEADRAAADPLADHGISPDDEDIVEAGEAGPAVVERLLGGTVITEESDHR